MAGWIFNRWTVDNSLYWGKSYWGYVQFILLPCIHTMNRGVSLIDIKIFNSKLHQGINIYTRNCKYSQFFKIVSTRIPWTQSQYNPNCSFLNYENIYLWWRWTSETSKISEGRERKVSVTAQTKHRILIIGDSDVRNYAEWLSDHLGHSFNVTGYVKLNADLDIIMTTAKSESKNMTKKEVIILWGGMKNIGKNDTYKGLHCISQFIGNKRHTKVKIMEAPHRFDLVPTSCVNKEVYFQQEIAKDNQEC